VDGQGAPGAGGYVRCLDTGASDAPESDAMASIALGAINTYGGRPWPVAEHTIALVALCGSAWEPSNSLLLDSVHPIE
jgi:hypothetical protein